MVTQSIKVIGWCSEPHQTHRQTSFICMEVINMKPGEKSIILLLLKEELRRTHLSSTFCDKTVQNKLTFFGGGGGFFGPASVSATHSHVSSQERDGALN